MLYRVGSYFATWKAVKMRLPSEWRQVQMDTENHKFGVENTPNTDSQKNLCVHELVSLHATRSPDSLAMVSGAISLSYRDVEVRANRIAHYLQTLGIGPDSVVGLCMDRSVDQIASALAVVKAGWAYLPIDPGYPV